MVARPALAGHVTSNENSLTPIEAEASALKTRIRLDFILEEIRESGV
jgi:hypothetical protein